MAKVGRNEPCPCGSGRKVKRCCGVRGGPSEESLARAFLAHASREAAGELRRLSDAELLDLFEELWELPAADLSLQVELPKLLSPELNRLCDAVADDDPDPELLDAAVVAIDTPSERARLARAVIAQAQAQAIDARLADAALIDLGSDSRQLLRAGLLEAVAVRVGAARTPAGILLPA
ncbi:MAG: SEC-C domain-containing protein [Thermoleophilaceae bacterium]|nr:SEC-C domain-containing protein [Thermoleophilaceae bacterium]